MTRNTCVSAFICGSHIWSVQPSELESIKVGPPSRPSTETLSRQPSAYHGHCGVSVLFPLKAAIFAIEAVEQAVDQGLGSPLIGHRLEQCRNFLGRKMRGD